MKFIVLMFKMLNLKNIKRFKIFMRNHYGLIDLRGTFLS
jgi:hypothetical protein